MTQQLVPQLGNEVREAPALHTLGYVALNRGNPAGAAGLFTDALLLYEGRRYDQGVAECLAGLGRVALAKGPPERAAGQYGAADAILEKLGTRLDILGRFAYERTLAALGVQLADTLEGLLDEEKAMPIATAVKVAAGRYCAGE